MTSLPETTHRFLAGIARDHLKIDERAVESHADYHAKPGLLAETLREAYEAGYRAATAYELGVTGIVFRPDAERFPWQVFCTEERCVLISRDGNDHMLIVSELRLCDDAYRMPIESVPPELIEIVRRELYGARG